MCRVYYSGDNEYKNGARHQGPNRHVPVGLELPEVLRDRADDDQIAVNVLRPQPDLPLKILTGTGNTQNEKILKMSEFLRVYRPSVFWISERTRDQGAISLSGQELGARIRFIKLNCSLAAYLFAYISFVYLIISVSFHFGSEPSFCAVSIDYRTSFPYMYIY